ncbi:ABC transporter permease [Salipiger thiooxidans]|uniref:ABC transporter permease n=1 Tax=Salipiger thiooxidans TaxID=282683 RepID=UPI001A8D2C5B|nr:ABC transporter permease [Salipiger thiooxidans]MBN8188674.1 ABC transporter permease [Salipiger thiooxidans]
MSDSTLAAPLARRTAPLSHRLLDIAERSWPAVLILVALTAGWEWACAALAIKPYILPAPSAILTAALNDVPGLARNAGITAWEATAGFVIGSALGALLGTAFAYSRFLARGFLPFIIAANTIPVVAIAPIIIIWFGHGIGSKIAVTAFLSFFPLALNMMKGLQSYDRTVADVFHIAAASPLQTFFKMRLPSALPYVFVGLKLNVTFSVIGAIVAEFVQADRGLGFVIMTTYRTMAMPKLWAAMLLSALMGILFFLVVAMLERIFVPWHASMSTDP